MKKITAISHQKSKWDYIKSKLNLLGSALIFPISLMAFVSLFLGLSFVLPQEFLITIFIKKISSIIFTSFPILIYLTIIIHYHEDKKNDTMINAIIVLFIFIGVQSIIVKTEIIPKNMINELGNLTSYDGSINEINLISFSIFSMMVLSSIFIYIDNRIMNKQLHILIGFVLVFVLTPIFMCISVAISLIGFLINLLPFGFSAFAYGFTNRMLLPFGLHTTLIPTFLYTEAGGLLTIYDQVGNAVETVGGDSQIWVYMYTNGLDFTKLSGSFVNNGIEYTYSITNSYNIGQYQQGFLPMISFAFPMLGITYILICGWEKGKTFFLATIFTLITGVTEMTEFMFIFISPILYITNAIMFGLSFWILNLLNVSVWISTGWIVDILLFGILPTIQGYATNWYWIPIVGISIGLIYSSIFYLILSKRKSSLKLDNLNI